jgi:F-type H+-transporting ATPase subunit c
MSKRSVVGVLVAIAAVAVASPVFAQGEPVASKVASVDVVAMWSIITAGCALAIAAGLGALGQGKAIASAAEGIARNPSAAGEIRGVLILGLVLIESLSIYVLLISLILFFLKPFSA